MGITNLVRDYGVDPCIVRMQTTDSFATITTAGYLTTQAPVIYKLLGGPFQFISTDMILCTYNVRFPLGCKKHLSPFFHFLEVNFQISYQAFRDLLLYPVLVDRFHRL